jgi:hypothetical protein
MGRGKLREEGYQWVSMLYSVLDLSINGELTTFTTHSPFVLLTGTVIVLILLIVGSISLLYGVGYQEMPSTLMGGAVGTRKE